MAFKLLFTEEAVKNLLTLENDNSKYKQLKAVYKSLGVLVFDLNSFLSSFNNLLILLNVRLNLN